MPSLTHNSSPMHEIAQRVGTLDTHVAVAINAPLAVKNNDRDIAIATYDGEYQTEVGALIGIIEGTHGLGPNLHTGALLTGEVAHQVVREDKRAYTEQYSNDDEDELYGSSSINPFHNDQV